MREDNISIEEIEQLRREAAMFRNLQRIARIGWWRVDFTDRQFTCSDQLADVMQLKTQSVSFDAIRQIVHPDDYDRVLRNLLMFPEMNVYDETFRLQTKMSYLWVHSRLGEKEITADGHVVAQGFMQHIPEEEAELTVAEKNDRQMRELQMRQNGMSVALLTLLKYSDEQDVIDELLESLQAQFDADRVYIFKYDHQNKTHSCCYEALKKGVTPEMENLQQIPIETSHWWSEQLFAHKPIVLNNLDDLPPEATGLREVLGGQGIKSLMVMPLIDRGGTWGYIGIDIVERYRYWNEVDRQWFSTAANIISVCLELKRSESAILREKEYFRNLYMHMPLGYARLRVVYDQAGRPADYLVEEINPAVTEITHLPADRIIGRGIDDPALMLPGRVLDDLNRVVTEGVVVSNGQERLKNNRYFRMLLFSTDRDSVTVLFSDETDSIRAQRALQRSEQRLQNIFDTIPVGIEIYDKNGNMQDFNSEDMRIFGVKSKKEVLGLSLFDNPNVSPAERAAVRAGKKIEFVMDYDFSKAREEGYYSSNHSGKRTIFARCTPLCDAEGNIEQYVIIVVDNTESTRTYHRLRDIEYRFNYMAESAQIGLCRWIPSLDSFTASEQWYSNVNQVGPIPHIYDAYTKAHPDDFVKLRQFFTDAVAGRAQGFRDVLRVRNGTEWKWIRCTYRVKRDEQDGNIEVIGLNVDITELKQTELRLQEAKLKAEGSDRMKSAFLANMSHEIRTPLNAIVGFSNLLIEAEDVDERREYVDIIQRNNCQLLQLVSDVLDLSKIEAGMIEITYEKVELNRLVQEVVQGFGADTARTVPVTFVGAGDPCHLISDRAKLAQILSNLINNAIKFTSQGSITVGFHPQQQGVEFYVHDTGIGIAPEDISLIFNRFEKLDHFAQGTGLGLTICRNLVEKLGGRIGVDSEPGKGSRFWFTIPYEPEGLGRDKKMQFAVRKPTSDMTQGKPVILIAEDTDSNYQVLSAILRDEYDLLRARDGEEAVMMADQYQFVAVLMDMKMPVMDGLEATRRIKESNPTLPVIAVTAYAYDHDRQQAFNAGCNDYLTKPMDIAELKKKLSSFIR